MQIPSKDTQANKTTMLLKTEEIRSRIYVDVIPPIEVEKAKKESYLKDFSRPNPSTEPSSKKTRQWTRRRFVSRCGYGHKSWNDGSDNRRHVNG